MTESANCDVQSKTQYRYRDTTYKKEYSAWGSWSSWSTTAASANDLRQVETKTETQHTYKTVYHYSRWRYIGKNGNWWYAPKDYSNSSNYVRNGSWQYKTSDTPLAKNGTAGGATLYVGSWYNQTTEQVVDTTKTVTYYRTRTRTTKNVPVVGSWTAWSDRKPENKNNREIDKRSVYRYRTR